MCTCVANSDGTVDPRPPALVCFYLGFSRATRRTRVPTTTPHLQNKTLTALSGTCVHTNTRACSTWATVVAQSSMLNYPLPYLHSNASPQGFGCGEQPVENNSCECQKWESQDSLTFCGPHTRMDGPSLQPICPHYRDQL